MLNGEKSMSARAMLENLAGKVVVRTPWPQWHIEEVQASPNGACSMLIFTSLTDRTVEEVVASIELSDAQEMWTIDLIDREALPLMEPVELPSGATGELVTLQRLSETVASLEDRIVDTLNDLRRGF